MGHAIEARFYAEDPVQAFLPTPGRLGTVSWPNRPGLRIDAGYESGDLIPSEYDSMIAKVISRGAGRDTALAELRLALVDTIVAGRPTNLPWLVNLIDDNDVRAGQPSTDTAASVALSLPDRKPALFAIACSLLRPPANAATDAWQSIGPWNSAGRARLRFHGEHWDDSLTVEVDGRGVRLAATSGQPNARAWRNPDGAYGVAWADRMYHFAVSRAGDVIEAAGGGGRWSMRLGDRPLIAARTSSRSGDGMVRSPLPATVVALHATVGEHVSQGQPIVTVYAMKMELACTALLAGNVQSIDCAIGDLVHHGQILARIEADPESAER
jgi:acetyl/propionyl-CoA carboxylase alpha subunit